MSYVFEETTNQYQIERMLNIPSLYKLLFGAEKSPKSKEAKMEYGYRYLFVKKGKVPIGFVKYRGFGSCGVEIHLGIADEGNKLKQALEISREFISLLKDNEKITKLITFAPEHARHSKILIHRLGFKLSGTVPDCIHYANRLQSLQIYSLDV